MKGPPTANIAIQTDQKSKIACIIHGTARQYDSLAPFLTGVGDHISHCLYFIHYFVFVVLNLEEVKIENEDLQAEVDQLRNQLVFAEENNARRIREIKTESSNEVKVFKL